MPATWKRMTYLPLSPPPPNQPPTITHLISALTADDHNIKVLIQFLPEDWSSYNACGTLVTKRQLL